MHDYYDGVDYVDQDDMVAHELDEDFIEHYGVPRRSGRYPWGSGDNPYQHEDYFDGFYNRLLGFRKDGLSEEEQAAKLGFANLKEFRNAVAEAETIHNFNEKYLSNVAATGVRTHHNKGSELDRLDEVRERIRRETGLTKDNEINNLAMKEFGFEKSNAFRDWRRKLTAEERQSRLAFAKALREEGKTDSEIARLASKEWGYDVPSSTIAELFKNKKAAEKMTRVDRTAQFLRDQVAQKGFIDVGKGTNLELPENDFDVPVGGVSSGVWSGALKQLESQGYLVQTYDQKQVGNDKNTTVTVLAAPGTTYDDGWKALKADGIDTIVDYRSEDHGESYASAKMEKPVSVDSKRIFINYADQGGLEKDGVIEIRPGVKDLDLNGAAYAQVRIAVDEKSYLKGMAVYSDSIPEGYDIRFNSNKKTGTPLEKVLKPLETKIITHEDGTKEKVIDWENPFGAALKRNGTKIMGAGQYTYEDVDGTKKLSCINKIREEDDWADYKQGNNRLPAQFLSKQPEKLVKAQLEYSLANKTIEMEEISRIAQPTIKRYYLNEFAMSCDKDASTLSAAAIPGQKYKVILPINSLKPTECYAPAFHAGEKLALIRFPHQATFEIPVVTNNLNNAEGKKFYAGKVGQDMIGIHYKTAAHLSGADFDGDTALCIPLRGKLAIEHKPYWKDLEDFDPKTAYASREEVAYDKKGKEKKIYINEETGKAFTPMSKAQKGQEMGKITNLITDISAQEDPDPRDLVRAIRQAYVVIDAEKHKLDWKQSAKDNGIEELKKKYQIHPNEFDKNGNPKYGGSSTLFSRAHSPAYIDQTQGTPWVNLKENEGKFKDNKETIPMYDPTKPEGALLYKKSGKKVPVFDKGKGKGVLNEETGKIRYPIKTDADGNPIYVPKQTKTVAMYTVEDARELLGNEGKGYNQKERDYADYANALKDMARQARIQAAHIASPKVNMSAKAQYSEEVDSLNAKLREAEMNAPRERAAQREAYNRLLKYEASHPDASGKDKKKARTRFLAEGRTNVNAEGQRIKITDREMDAIRAGAVASSTVDRILRKADPDILRQHVTPKQEPVMTAGKLNKAKSMASTGVPLSVIADECGVSVSTISKYLKEPELLSAK